MAKYDSFTWCSMTPFLVKFPHDSREDLKDIIKEGQLVARRVRDVSDTIVRCMTNYGNYLTGIGLQASGISRKV